MPKLDLKKHVKIWFAANPDEPFGGIINELRLIRHRLKNPDHEINLITDMSRLSMVGIKKLEKFSKQHRINIIDITNLKPQGNREKDLFVIVQKEMSLKGGSLAAASDILRWLKPILNLGIYSDLDDEVDFSKIKDKSIEVKDFLLPISGLSSDGKYLTVANNVIAFPNTKHSFIDKVQMEMWANYENGAEEIIASRLDFNDMDLTGDIITRTGPKCVEEALYNAYYPPTKKGEDKNWFARGVLLDSLALQSSPLKKGFSLKSDKSWLEEGRKELNQQEIKIKNSALRIQRFWKERNLSSTKQPTTTKEKSSAKINKLSKK